MADSKNKKANVVVPAKLVGITVPKETNCGQWYVEVVQKAELVEYYSEVSCAWIHRHCPVAWIQLIMLPFPLQISGFYILRRTYTMRPIPQQRPMLPGPVRRAPVDDDSQPLRCTSGTPFESSSKATLSPWASKKRASLCSCLPPRWLR
jgi:hypothetical protein